MPCCMQSSIRWLMAREPVEAEPKAPVTDRLRERAKADPADAELLTEAAAEVDTLKAKVAELEAAVPVPPALPDAESPEATMMLQRALGHVAVDGILGPQTEKAVRRARERAEKMHRPPAYHEALERAMLTERGAVDQDFIAALLRRVS